MGNESASRGSPLTRGEVLKLGPPAAGEVAIFVDGRQSGGSFAMGTQTLLPGAAIPLHRHQSRDEVWVIHKGQGRLTVGGRSVIAVPGATVCVPRQTWYGIQNTGTGTLVWVWVSSPAGIEEFFREFSRLAPAPDPSAIHALITQHGMELQAAAAPQGAALATTAKAPGSGPRPSGPSGPQGRRRRHRGGRGRRRGGPPQAAPTAPIAPRTYRPVGPEAPPPPTTRPAAPSLPRPRREPRRTTPRMKEVYMGGRWVPVTGEGPMISPGRERPGSRRRRGKRSGDNDTPQGPLSVSL